MNKNILKIGLWWNSLDKWILSSTFILIIIGIFLILTSTDAFIRRNEINNNFLFTKHLLLVPIASLVILSTSTLSIKNLVSFSIFIFLVFSILSIVPIIENNSVKGASRWLYFNSFSIQPSEFLKPSFFVLSATLLSRYKKKNDYSFNISILLTTFVGIILFAQPDIGMLVLIFTTWFLLLVISGISSLFLVSVSLFGMSIFILAYFLLDHVKFRIHSFLFEDVGDSYQILKSIKSFSSGGFFGKGLGEGEVSKNLPDSYSDFIFSVAAEELGFFFICFIILLYIVIFFRCIYLAYYQNNLFIFLALTSLSILFIMQSMINILSTINLIPTKGMTLPFLSYGGSSLISSSMTIGFILSLVKKKYER